MTDRELREQVDQSAMVDEEGKQRLHLVITASFFYFRDDVTQSRRDVVACLRDYLDMTSDYMTLWAMHGKGKKPFSADTFDVITKTHETLPIDNAMEFYIMDAKSKTEAAAFSIDSFSKQDWQIALGKDRGISEFKFCFPLSFFSFTGFDFTSFFDICAERLRPFYAYAGVGPGMPFDEMKIFYLSPTLFMLAWAMPEFEIDHFPSTLFIHEGIRPPSWMTALGREEVETLGGVNALRTALPEGEGFRLHEHAHGLTIRAGTEPIPGRKLFGTKEEFLADEPGHFSGPQDILARARGALGEDRIAALRRMISGEILDIPKAPKAEFPLLYKLAAVLKPLRAPDPYQLQSDFYGSPYFDKARTLQYYSRFDD